MPDELGVLRLVTAAGTATGPARTPTASVAAIKAVFKENIMSE